MKAITMSALGAMLIASAASAQTPSNMGDLIVDARLRYESVSQDGLEDANAVTLRTRLGYETRAWHGFRLLGEVEGVGQLSDDFNDTVNGNTQYAIVADPEAFELNRLQIAWSGAEGRRVVLGRQRIVLNNARGSAKPWRRLSCGGARGRRESFGDPPSLAVPSRDAATQAPN